MQPHPIWDATWPSALAPYKTLLQQRHVRWQWNGQQWYPAMPKNPFKPPLDIPVTIQAMFSQWEVLRQPPPTIPPITLTRETLPIKIIRPDRWHYACDLLAHAGCFSLDTETTVERDRRNNQVMVIQFGWRDPAGSFQTAIANVGHWTMDWQTPLRQALRQATTVIGHNLQFDGMVLHWQESYRLWDTSVAPVLLYPEDHRIFISLKDCAERYCGITMDKSTRESDWSQPLTEEQMVYAAWDAAVTYWVYEAQWPEILTNGLDQVMDLEMRTLPILIQMEANGIPFDAGYAQTQQTPATLGEQYALDQWTARMGIPRDLFGTAQINPNSNDQVLMAFHALGAPIPSTSAQQLARLQVLACTKRYQVDPASYPAWMRRWTKAVADAGGPTANLYQLWMDPAITPPLPHVPKTWLKERRDRKNPEKIERADEAQLYAQLPSEPHRLEQLIESIEWFFLFRQYTGIKEKWTELLGFQQNGAVYPSYHLMVPSGTGRMSVEKPQTQNIPHTEAFRKAFRPRPGYKFLVGDLPAIELRTLAFIAGEKVLYDAFVQQGDPHRTMAAAIYHKPPEAVTKTERQNAKSCFSGDTEVLTQQGWVRFDQYDGITPIAEFVLPSGKTWNRSAKGNRWEGPDIEHSRWDGKGTLQFMMPIAFKSFENREVWALKNKHLDFLMTPDHELVGVSQKGGPVKKTLAETAKHPFRYLIAAAEWKHTPTWSELETRILAMVVSDGSIRSNTHFSLGFSKARKIERCRALLTQAHIPFRETHTQPEGNLSVTSFMVISRAWTERLLQLTTPQKTLAWEALSAVDGSVYLHEAAHWDGHITDDGHSTRGLVRFTTTNRQTAEVMQAMAVTHGTRCDITEIPSHNPKHATQYRVVYRLTKVHLLNMNGSWGTSIIPSNQTTTVYCVQVPSGAILVRRNGHIAICSNCNFGYGYGMNGETYVWQKTRETFLSTGDYLQVEGGIQFFKAFHTQYPAIDAWHKTFPKKVEETKMVRTVSGRWRKWQGQPGYSEILNTPAQGAGVDIIKDGLIRVDAALKPLGGRILTTVHDEIVAEIPMDQAEAGRQAVQHAMAEAAEFWLDPIPVPVECVIADSWADKA